MKFTKFGHTIIRSKLAQSLFPLLFPFIKYAPFGSKKIFITVDVEAGYIDSTNIRKWMRNNPDAFQGYLYGLKYILSVLDKENVKATFYICPQGFIAPYEDNKEIIALIKKAYKSGHQIGLHLHPKEDVLLHKILGKTLEYTSAKHYSTLEIDEILKAERQILKQFLGSKIEKHIVSFRWGNFASDNRVFPLLFKNHFSSDSSVSPMQSGHSDDDRAYDWKNIKSNKNYIKGGVKEIPITSFKLGPLNIRAEIFFGSLLNILISRGGQINVMTHSCDCSYENGQPTYVVRHLQKMIQFAKVNNYKFSLIK